MRTALVLGAGGLTGQAYHLGVLSALAEAGQAWDAVLLVRYPSRQAFSDMVRDPAYNAGTHLRTDALEEAVLQATVPWPG